MFVGMLSLVYANPVYLNTTVSFVSTEEVLFTTSFSNTSTLEEFIYIVRYGPPALNTQYLFFIINGWIHQINPDPPIYTEELAVFENQYNLTDVAPSDFISQLYRGFSIDINYFHKINHIRETVKIKEIFIFNPNTSKTNVTGPLFSPGLTNDTAFDLACKGARPSLLMSILFLLGFLTL